MNLTACLSSLIRFIPKFGLLITVCFAILSAESSRAQVGLSSERLQYREQTDHSSIIKHRATAEYQLRLPSDTTKPSTQQFPDPNKVMYKSLMIPGWGQVINNQIWKVPIVYALLGGLTYYSIHLNKRYHDYRAAFYNINHQDGDRPYGPTPGYLQTVTSSQSLKNNRNYYRNRRDFIYITIGLAYGLNAIDAYVFAHMRSFNVSDDLSIKTGVEPGIERNSPILTLRLELHSQ